VAKVSERTIPIERQPLVCEVSANFCGYKVPRAQREGFLRPYARLSRPEPLLFLPSSSSVVLTRLSGPRSRPSTSQKIWYRRESNPGPLYLQPGTLSTRPQRRSTFFCITYINSVHTSQETQYISVPQSGTLASRSQRRSLRQFIIIFST
jgi:hypothetical protein